LLNGTRRLGALAIAAAIFASACSSTAATSTPAATPAPVTTAAAATSAPAAATPTTAATAAINCVTGTITASGSTALQPLVTAAAKQYDAACPGATITVNPGGSGIGLTQVASGAVQIGNSDVTAQSKLATPMPADGLVDHIVARQGWIVVTNKDVTGVTNLTTQQQIDIWTGKDTNWNQVGGPDMPIVLIFRPSSSGTRSTFKKLVLGNKTEAIGGQTLTEDSNGAVTTAITKTNGAVSVIGFAYYNDPANKPNLNGLQLDGVDATVANMSSGTYKLAADGHMYTLGTPATGSLTEAFLAYMMGPDIQGTLIPSLFYAPVAK
jgi:phosphate transport system substrate-binding protein